jgi:hypothetical protein
MWREAREAVVFTLSTRRNTWLGRDFGRLKLLEK